MSDAQQCAGNNSWQLLADPNMRLDGMHASIDDEARDPRLGLFNAGLTEGSDTPAAAEPTEAVAPEDGASRKSGGCAVQPSHVDVSIVLLDLVVLGLRGRRRSQHLAILSR